MSDLSHDIRTLDTFFLYFFDGKYLYIYIFLTQEKQMFNNNKAFHCSNLYEENLARSSKMNFNYTQPASSKISISSQLNNKSIRNENSFGVIHTEPTYSNDSQKYHKIKGIPNSTPLNPPNKDPNKLAELINPTDNPAYFLKE